MIRRNKINFELEITELLSFYLCARSVLKKILIHALCRVINEKTKHTHTKKQNTFFWMIISIFFVSMKKN